MNSEKQLAKDVAEKIRKLYKTYLNGQGLGRNTVNSDGGCTFYLWNKEQSAFPTHQDVFPNHTKYSSDRHLYLRRSHP